VPTPGRAPQYVKEDSHQACMAQIRRHKTPSSHPKSLRNLQIRPGLSVLQAFGAKRGFQQGPQGRVSPKNPLDR
jgi:hypothetical protein